MFERIVARRLESVEPINVNTLEKKSATMLKEGERAKCTVDHDETCFSKTISLKIGDIVAIVNTTMGKDEGLCLIQFGAEHGMFPCKFLELEETKDKTDTERILDKAEESKHEDRKQNCRLVGAVQLPGLSPQFHKQLSESLKKCPNSKLENDEGVKDGPPPQPPEMPTSTEITTHPPLPHDLLAGITNAKLNPINKTEIEPEKEKDEGYEGDPSLLNEDCKVMKDPLHAELERNVVDRSPNHDIDEIVAKNKLAQNKLIPVVFEEEKFQRRIAAQREKAENGATGVDVDSWIKSNKDVPCNNEPSLYQNILKPTKKTEINQSSSNVEEEIRSSGFHIKLKPTNKINKDQLVPDSTNELQRKLSRRLSFITNDDQNVPIKSVSSPIPPIPRKPIKIAKEERISCTPSPPPQPIPSCLTNEEDEDNFPLPPPPSELLLLEQVVPDCDIGTVAVEHEIVIPCSPIELEGSIKEQKFELPVPPPLPGKSDGKINNDITQGSRSQLFDQIRTGLALKSINTKVDMDETTAKAFPASQEKIMMKGYFAINRSKIADSDDDEKLSNQLDYDDYDDDEWEV